MLQKIANSILARFGLRIVAAPAADEVLYPPTSEERRRINEIFEEFASDQENPKIRSSIAEWMDYLDDSRISFFEVIIRLLESEQVVLEDKRIADFGSGTGYLLRLIHQSCSTAKLTGYDSFETFNALARKICPAATFKKDFDAEDQSFDVIFCTEVLEHLKFPAAAIQQFLSRLNDGGILVLTVPNGRTDSHEARKIREDGTGYWGHIHFWSPESWALFLQDTLRDQADFKTGLLETKGNFAVIRKVTG